MDGPPEAEAAGACAGGERGGVGVVVGADRRARGVVEESVEAERLLRERAGGVGDEERVAEQRRWRPGKRLEEQPPRVVQPPLLAQLLHLRRRRRRCRLRVPPPAASAIGGGGRRGGGWERDGAARRGHERLARRLAVTTTTTTRSLQLPLIRVISSSLPLLRGRHRRFDGRSVFPHSAFLIRQNRCLPPSTWIWTVHIESNGQ